MNEELEKIKNGNWHLLNDLKNELKFDEHAHIKGTCSFELLALCSAEEQKIKILIEKAFQSGRSSVVAEIRKRMPEKKKATTDEHGTFISLGGKDFNQALDKFDEILTEVEKT